MSLQHRKQRESTFAVVPIWPLAVLLFVSGCSHDKKATYREPPPARTAVAQRYTVTNTFNPEWLETPTNRFTLGPGDRLEIEVVGDPASRSFTVIAPDGKLYYNMLPGIDVWGMTLNQAKDALEKAFGEFMREPPRVSIVLRSVESKRVWILGRVQAPGVYSMAAPMTLLEAISMAGGTMSLTSFRDQAAAGINEELADLPHSFVLREGKRLPVNFQKLLVEGDLSQNIYLQPDDFVYLPGATARDIYVLGAVVQPRPVPYSENLTVAAAIASAYGTLREAYVHHVAVVRGSLAQPEMIIVDYKDVIRGKEKDIQLQPHDIVYVPFAPYRYIQRYAEIILNTFVSATAINAGSYAVTKQPTLSGIFIPAGSGIQVVPPVAPPPIR